MSFEDFEEWKKNKEEKKEWLPKELYDIIEERDDKKRKRKEWEDNKKKKGEWLPLKDFIELKNKKPATGASAKRPRSLKPHSEVLGDLADGDIIKREVLFDTETTGLGRGHKIVEVSFIEVIDGVKTGKYLQTFFNPEREISKGAYMVHKITNEDVKNSPLFKDKAVEIIEFIGTSSLVAHNARFDMGMLNDELETAGWEAYENKRFICTLKMARHLYPKQKNKLDVLCERFGVDNKNRLVSKRHSAHEDTILLYHVYIKLIELLDEQHFTPYDFTL